MNTEKLNTLAAVHQALDKVVSALSNKKLTQPERETLESIVLKLREVERSIVRKKTLELVDLLTQDTQELNQLVERIRAATKKLEGVTKAVGQAVKVIEGLVQIIATASSVGLLK